LLERSSRDAAESVANLAIKRRNVAAKANPTKRTKIPEAARSTRAKRRESVSTAMKRVISHETAPRRKEVKKTMTQPLQACSLA